MRIISLVPSVTETLFELGLDDQIVAVTRWCNRPTNKVTHKPKIGGTKNPKLESIVEFKPDLVILDRDENRKQDADDLQRRGIRTFTVFPKTIQDSIELIRNFGEMFSVENRSKIMIDEIEHRLETQRPARTYASLILIWRAPYMTINSDTYVHAASSLFGFRNCFADHQQRYPAITPPEIAQINPDVVLFPDEPYPFRKKHIETFKQEFPDLSATLNNRMLPFDGGYIAWHGFGMLRALREFPAVIASQFP